MLTDVLIQLYGRDLNKLKAEIEQYSIEADLWEKPGDVPNSAGNLTLHLIGNLKHYFGAMLGGTDYVRVRDLEFSDSGVGRDRLLTGIDEAADVVKSTLEGLTESDLEKTYPQEVFGHPMTTEYFLVHLAGHLNWHLGQINYLRRVLGQARAEARAKRER